MDFFVKKQEDDRHRDDDSSNLSHFGVTTVGARPRLSANLTVTRLAADQHQTGSVFCGPFGRGRDLGIFHRVVLQMANKLLYGS